MPFCNPTVVSFSVTNWSDGQVWYDNGGAPVQLNGKSFFGNSDVGQTDVSVRIWSDKPGNKCTISAGNRTIGYPWVMVETEVERQWHNFSEDESFTFNIIDMPVRVHRRNDGDDGYKRFDIFIGG